MANGLIAMLLQVTITANNKWIDFHFDEMNYEASITEGVYADMRAVLTAVIAAMNAEIGIPASVAGALAIDAAGVGYVTINATSQAVFTLYWINGDHGSDALDTHVGTELGYDDSADDSGAYSYTADDQHMHGWYDTVGAQFESRSRKKKIGPGTFIAVSGKATRTIIGDQNVRRSEHAWIEKEKFYAEFADTNEAFELWWDEAAEATPFKFYRDSDDWTDEGTWVLIQQQDEDLLEPVPRLAPGSELYSVTLRMVKQPTDADVIT
jgi:hypothetical protein